MTYQEAIDKLKESVNYYDTECPEDKVSKFAWKRMQELTEVYQLAIAALEKQEPMKPDYEADGYGDGGELVYDTWICPCCGEKYEADYDDYDFCPKCGQALNWEDTE